MIWPAFLATALALAASEVGAARSDDGRKLVWSDEFSVDGRPDPAKWTFEQGFRRNREMQWYQAQNAFVKDGLLVIEARREDRGNPDFGKADQPASFAGRRRIRFTSASVTTRGLHSWRYGRLEVRARIRAEDGLWPAIWTLGASGRWPANGEVDVMEYYHGSVLANFGWAGPDRSGRPKWLARQVPLKDITTDPAWDETFHVWTMEWTADRIAISLDGHEMNRIDLTSVDCDPRTGSHPFRQPHYLLLNLALGGDHGGPLAETTFPSRYEIDYVRLYQRDGES